MKRRLSVLRIARRLRRHDDGIAMVLVVGTMMVLASMTMVALGYAMSSTKLARYDQDFAAAEAAAQSGIDDFVSRMNRDYVYADAIDCTNDAWKGPLTTTNPCGWTASTAPGWLPVTPGDTDPKAAQFHYAVDISQKKSGGNVGLTVTGRVNGVYRTLQTLVGKHGSTDYVYYTDFESADPDNVQVYSASTVASTKSSNPAKANACGFNGNSLALYWWKKDQYNKTRADYGCTEIQFTGGDDLDGEVFTNDSIFAVPSGGNQPTFEKQVYTGDQRCAQAGTTTASWNTYCLRSGSGSTNAADFKGFKPKAADLKYLDDTSAQFATNPGCHYYGSTRVVFNGDGTMNVWNKTSVNGGTAPVSIAAPGKTAPSCGSLTDLNSDGGAHVAVPTEQVIYVAPAPSTVATRQCYSGELGGPTTARRLPLGTLTLSQITSTVGSSSTSYYEDSNMLDSDKACSRGNLYAEGVIQGRVTLAAAESVIVTGDLLLKGGTDTGSQDMLGLVATNSVEVMHPRMVTFTAQKLAANCTTANYGQATTWQYCSSNEQESNVSPYNAGTWPWRYNDPTHGNAPFPTSGIQIAGSIQTLQHSFWVQKYNVGSGKGELFVKGSIAQRWRGIVGTAGGSTGYIKNYDYDTRLKFTSPPYFPKWATSEWTLTYSGEIDTPAKIRG